MNDKPIPDSWPKMGDLAFLSIPGSFDDKVTVLDSFGENMVYVHVDSGRACGCIYAAKREHLSPRTGDEPETMHDRGMTPVGVSLEDSKPIPGTNPVQYEPITVHLSGGKATRLLDEIETQKMSLEELRRFRDELNTIIYDKERGK